MRQCQSGFQLEEENLSLNLHIWGHYLESGDLIFLVRVGGFLRCDARDGLVLRRIFAWFQLCLALEERHSDVR